MKIFKVGQAVECNGNKEGKIVRFVGSRTWEVRLRDGNRIVGVVATCESNIKPIESIPCGNMRQLDKVMGW